MRDKNNIHPVTYFHRRIVLSHFILILSLRDLFLSRKGDNCFNIIVAFYILKIISNGLMRSNVACQHKKILKSDFGGIEIYIYQWKEN